MSKTLKNALLVFAGGWCYGVVIPLVKVGQSMGFSPTELMAIQYLIGVFVLGFAYLVMHYSKAPRKTLLKLSLKTTSKTFTNTSTNASMQTPPKVSLDISTKRTPKIPLKQMLQLAGVGVLAAGVSFSYYNALALLSSAAALTLLFQFVWMGVLLQVILERKLPDRFSLLAVLLILCGTILAARVLEPQEIALNAPGVLFGLLSAAFYTAFLHFSGKVATDLPTVGRTLFTSIGSLLATACIAPVAFLGVTLIREFAWFGFPLALIGIILPVLLIQRGAPNISDGVTTIMASSELPSGILMAALFLGDPITLLEALGVVIILGGIVLSQFDSLRRVKKPAQKPADP